VAFDANDHLVWVVGLAARMHDRRPYDHDHGDRGEDGRRDERPDDLQARVPVDLRPLGVLGRRRSAAETQGEEHERRLDQHEDDRTDSEDQPVELVDRAAALRRLAPWREPPEVSRCDEREQDR